jgi:hypothetical protein
MGSKTKAGGPGFTLGGSDGGTKAAPAHAAGDATRASRTTFLVGRVTPGVGEIIVVDGPASPPFPGPWTLRAMVRSSHPVLGPPWPPAGMVH